MILKTFVEPPIENNNYLLIDEKTKEAVLIDCSAVDDRVKQELDNLGATLKYILLTHGHFDHVAGIRAAEAKVIMHENDLSILKLANNYLQMFGVNPITIPKIDIYINNDDVIKLGNTELRVIHTPGHTQGSVCYYADNVLFSGDTIFRESVGRCDLEGGNFKQIKESIISKIFTLPDDTLIYPGHGASTNVGWEKKHNMFM